MKCYFISVKGVPASKMVGNLCKLLTLLEPPGFSDFRKKQTAVFGCLTNALAPPPIALERCSAAQKDQPV